MKLSLLFALALGLTACSAPRSTPTTVPATETQAVTAAETFSLLDYLPTPVPTNTPFPKTATAAISPAMSPTITSTPAPWVLTWSDEFNGTELDVSLWDRYEGPSPRNGEDNYYTTEDVYVENGNLVIRQQKREFGTGRDKRYFTSGQVISVYPVGAGNGRLEVRGKPSTEQGFHSAYWMYDTVHWPPEIDLLEVIGSARSQAFMAWHYGTYPDEQGVSGIWLDPQGNLNQNYHEYAVEYDASQITWYIDGEVRFSTFQKIDQLASMPLKVLLDTAIGGYWEGNPDDTTVFPNYNYIDYVRIYQRGGTPIIVTPRVATSTPTITPIPKATATPDDAPQLPRVGVKVSSEESETLLADNAIDGKPATRWSSLYADPQWIYVDLGTVKDISRVVLRWETACGKNYEIQVSDDALNWTTVRTVTGNNILLNDLTALNAHGRYVRMYGKSRYTPYGFSLYEFEVYGK